jgi:hypothetical protein
MGSPEVGEHPRASGIVGPEGVTQPQDMGISMYLNNYLFMGMREHIKKIGEPWHNSLGFFS